MCFDEIWQFKEIPEHSSVHSENVFGSHCSIRSILVRIEFYGMSSRIIAADNLAGIAFTFPKNCKLSEEIESYYGGLKILEINVAFKEITSDYFTAVFIF